MTLQEIAEDIKGKRSLSDLDEEFLKSRILEKVDKYKIDVNKDFKKLKRKDRYKEFFKDIRKTLRKIYGVYREIKENKIKGKASIFNAFDNYNDKLPKTDVIFLFRMLESLESIEKGSSERLFKKLKAKIILVSFSKIALNQGEEIKKKGRSWFRRMLSKNGYSFEDFDLEDEIFFLIK